MDGWICLICIEWHFHNYHNYHNVKYERPIPKDIGESGNRKGRKLCNGDFVISDRFLR